jgi:microcystin-dependent protein
MRGNYDDGMGHTGGVQVYAAAAPNTPLAAATAVGLTGGGLPHNNMMPYLTLNFCIALQGIYPARP